MYPRSSELRYLLQQLRVELFKCIIVLQMHHVCELMDQGFADSEVFSEPSHVVRTQPQADLLALQRQWCTSEALRPH